MKEKNNLRRGSANEPAYRQAGGQGVPRFYEGRASEQYQ